MSLDDYSTSVWCYRGNVMTPNWRDIDTSESITLFLSGPVGLHILKFR